MADTFAPSMSTRRGDADCPTRRSPFAARRRVFVVVVLLVVAGITIAANYGPMQAYRDAKARLEQATTAVASLEQEKTELQSQLGKLSEAGYLESLAREELSYLKPGEELYIITGLEGTVREGIDDGAGGAPAVGTAAGDTSDQAGASDVSDPQEPATDPGFFERALNAILGLF